MRPSSTNVTCLILATMLCALVAQISPSIIFAASLPGTTVPSGLGVAIHQTSFTSQELTLLHNSGFQIARIDLPWSSIEGSPGVYNFSGYDGLVSQLLSINVRPLLILDRGNQYYDNGFAPYDSTGQTAFAKFAAAAAKHYAGDGVIWEIWNEPDLMPNPSTSSQPTWQPESNPNYWQWTASTNTYISLIKAVAPAIRGADNSSTILAGVTSGIPDDYIEALLRSGALSNVDALSVHPYRSSNPETVAADYDATRALIARYTPAGQTPLPIISSEWGYTMNQFSQQCGAAYLEREYLADLAAGVNTSVYYEWQQDASGDGYGILTSTDQPLTAYTDLPSFTSALSGYKFCHRMETGNPNEYNLLFAGPSNFITVDWIADDSTSDPNPPLPTLTTISPGNAAYNQLQLASSIEFAPDTLVATTGTQVPLNFTLVNPFSTTATVVVSNYGQTQTFTVPAYTTQPDEMMLSLSVVPGVQPLNLSFTWNGVPVTGITPPNATTASVFAMSSYPSGSNLAVNVTNPLTTAFSGQIVYEMAGSAVSWQSEPLNLAAGQTGQVVFTGCPSQAGTLQVIDSNNLVWGRASTESYVADANWPSSISSPTPYNDVTVNNGTNVASSPASVVTAPAGSQATIAITMDYTDTSQDQWYVLNPVSSDPIPTGANALSYWIYSDGTGVNYSAVFNDSSGQAFQPTAGSLDYPGWSLVTFALDGSSGNHWGGDDDGIVHGQSDWDVYGDADGHGGYLPNHSGSLDIAAPYYQYFSFGSGYHTIVNANSSDALVVQSGSTANNAPLIQSWTNGTANGLWQLVPTGNGSYRIVNANSGQQINIPGASSTPGTQLIQYPDDGNANSWWNIVPIGGGRYNIVSAYDGQYVEVSQSSTMLGAAVDQNTSTGDANQQWYIY